jgi:GT2 family glycosyltransferase
VLYAIDNASKDDSVQKLMADPLDDFVVFVNTENVGVAAGNNQGIRAALKDGATHILLINNDVRFSPDLVATLLREIDRCDAGMIVPKIYFADTPKIIWCCGGFLDWKRGYQPRHYGAKERDAGQFDTARWVEDAPTCCMLIRTEVFAKVGFMDERYFVYGDDTDFVHRAREAGFGLYYTPAVALDHKVSILTGGTNSEFSIRWSTRARGLFIAKHYRGLKRFAATAIFRMYLLSRRISGHDSPDLYKRRLEYFHEGIKVEVQGRPKAL